MGFGSLKIYVSVNVDARVLQMRTDRQTQASAGTKVAADGAYDTVDIHRYCAKHGLDPLILVRISFAGNANGCVSCKKAGFRQLGGFNHRQGCGTQVCRSYAPARGNFRGRGRKSQDTVAGLDRILHVQVHIRQVHECAKMGESQDMDMRQGVAVHCMIDTAIGSGYGTQVTVCPSARPPPKTARQEEKQ